MGCATGTVKYLLFIANLVFALAGLALLVVGVLIKIDLNQYEEAFPNDYKNLGLAPVLLIVVGAVIFVIAFMGCCGAIRESICLLTSFAVVLLAIFIIQVAIGTFAFLQVKDGGGDFRNAVQNTLTTLVNRYNNSQAPSNEVMDLIQAEFHCCGSTNATNYVNGPPQSCRNPEDSKLYLEGCADKFYNFLQDSLQIIGYVAIGIAVTEIVSAIFSLCLSSSIRNEQRRRGY